MKPVNKLPQPAALANTAHKTSFKDKATKLAKQSLAVDTRPPWKGGSGRHAIVDAPRDKPGQPIPQPKREERQRLQSPTSNSAVSPNAAQAPETQRVPVQQYPEDTTPDIVARNNVSREYESGTAGPSPQFPNAGVDHYSSPVDDRSRTPTIDQFYAGAAAEPRLSQHPALKNERSQPTYTEDSPPRTTQSSRAVTESPDPNFDSRFSWTTTATSTTYQQSVPPSPPPPMPTKYMNSASPGRVFSDSPASVKASVLDRGHPTRRLGTESPPVGARSFSAGSTLRKPVSSLAVSRHFDSLLLAAY